MKRRIRGVLAVALLGAFAGLALSPSAGAATTGPGHSAYAPVDRPGPALEPSPSELAASLTCSQDVGHSDKEPVLLVPGTAATFQSQWSWNFAVELSNLGIPWCGVSPPNRQLGDTQLAGEYDVYAIRYLFHHSGDRKIAIVGHSQGGMQPRWALRFWPDTRGMVADMIGISPDNQGATAERQGCAVLAATIQTCPINFWQGATGSNFITALNSGQQMFPGIDYSVIWSTTDELVQQQDTPLFGSGSYRWTTLQQVCPGHIADHVMDGTVDPVSWALTLDAITHTGPADPARISPTVCVEPVMPGLSPTGFEVPASQFALSVATAAADAPRSPAEPPLACYVFATGCATTAPSTNASSANRRSNTGLIANPQTAPASPAGAYPQVGSAGPVPETTDAQIRAASMRTGLTQHGGRAVERLPLSIALAAASAAALLLARRVRRRPPAN